MRAESDEVKEQDGENKEESECIRLSFGGSLMDDYRSKDPSQHASLYCHNLRAESKEVKEQNGENKEEVNVYVLVLLEARRPTTDQRIRHNMQVSTAITKNPRNGTASRDPQAYLPTKA